jgi:hypothetical protein
MRKALPLLAGFALLVIGTTAGAQQVSLDLRGGNVTLDARGATLEQILGEWARVGGTKIVTLRAPESAGPPVTILLRDMTEREALDILLRDVGGYLLFARRDATEGSSQFAQILLVPRSAAPATPAVGASEAGIQSSPAMNPRRLGPVVVEAPAELAPRSPDAPEEEEADANVSAAAVEIGDELQPVESAPPGNRGLASPNQTGARGNDTPPPTPLLPPSLAPDAANPFGKAPSTARPGVIVPGGPPPGVVYPPVTNPNADGATAPPAPRP